MDETKKEKLDELKKKMLSDDTLPLKKGATNLVFGVGNSDTEVLFVGEGPGYWEDVKGEPFVGNAGILLNKLLYSIKLPRESIYITNVVHHRPPENRDPYPNEIESYGKYLDRIIKIIRPKIIVTLGRYSMAKFLPDARISGVHGKVFDVQWEGMNLKVIPMYHPAAALRNTSILNSAQEDIKMITAVLKSFEKEDPKKTTTQMELI